MKIHYRNIIQGAYECWCFGAGITLFILLTIAPLMALLGAALWLTLK